MESSLVSSNCVCRDSCQNFSNSSFNYNDNGIEEYCLDNIDDIISDIGSETLKNCRNRTRAKKSSKSSDLMTIAESACGYRETSNSNASQHAPWNSTGWNHGNRSADSNKSKSCRNVKNNGNNRCCYMCQDKGCKPEWKDNSLNDTYVYDPGIEEFILDDNELSTSRYYGSPVDLNFDWSNNSRSKSKKSVKSVSIIDTLSELVSSNQEQPHQKPLKVRDVKNRNKKKNKQNFLNHKRLSSSLPLLNIPDNLDKAVTDETRIDARMSAEKEANKKLESVAKPRKKSNMAEPSKLTRRLSSFERAHTPDWLAKIFEITKKGCLQELKRLLEDMDGSLIMNLSDRHGNNLLHISCYYNHLNCLKWLLSICPESQHALIDENKSGLTPVVVAAKRGKQECVEWLVNNTISREQIYGEGGCRTLLHHAAKYGQLNVVEWITEFMLKTSQSIDVADHNGCTALHLAARYGKHSTVKYLVMHGADLNEKDNHGLRPYDHAIQHGQHDCAEYLLGLESSLAIASDVISLDNEFKNLKSENLEIKSCYKEALSLTKKLIKERELLKQQFRSIHGGFCHLDEMLSIEDSMAQDCQTSGMKNEELRKLVSSVNSSLKKSQINSPLDEHLKRIHSIEERWRRAKIKTNSSQVIRPIDVIRHHETQVKLKAGPEKTVMELESSSDSALSSPESEHSDDSGSESANKTLNNPSSPSSFGMPKNTSTPSTMSRSENRSKIKDYRKSPGNICPSFITAELAAAVRQSRRAPSKSKARHSNDKAYFSDVNDELIKEHRSSSDKNSFLIRAESQTCSVLEVLDPSSDDDNVVESKSFLVKSDTSVSGQSKVSMKIHKNYIQNPTSSNQRNHKNSNKNDYILSVEQTKPARKSKNHDNNIPDLYKKTSTKLSSHSRVKDDSDHPCRRRSPRQMLNRCAKSDIEDLDGPDFDDIGAIAFFESPRFSEPDLIKGTKSVEKSVDDAVEQENSYNQCMELMADVDGQPVSNVDRLSVSVSVASSANVEVQFPSVSSASESSVNSIGAILDSSPVYPPNVPKKKGFLLKFQTLKKRWPSRHKFTPNKKSQEITAEDFKETYMRQHGESKDGKAPAESCDRLLMTPRQRESVCSASSTSSNKQDAPIQKGLRRDNSDQLSMAEVESFIRDKGVMLMDKKESPKPALLSKRPPLPDVPPISEVPTEIPPPLFPGTHRSCSKPSSLPESDVNLEKKDLASSVISEQCSTNEEQGLINSLSCSASKADSMSRPASSASRLDFGPEIVTATAETVKAASTAASFPLHKSASLSTDLLSPDSSTAGRQSPAPSEISKTESALSPPSDVSKTESTRHLNQLEKIEEIKQVNASLNDGSVNNNKILTDQNSLLLVNSFKKTDASGTAQSNSDNKTMQEPLNRDCIAEASKRVRIRKTEKPWYEVSDDEDMPSPSRYEMVATAAMCSSSEDERVELGAPA